MPKGALHDPHELLRDLRRYLSRRRRRRDPAWARSTSTPQAAARVLRRRGRRRAAHGPRASPSTRRCTSRSRAGRRDAARTRAASAPADPGATASGRTSSRNHDELTLDKLSDDERAEVFAAFGPDPDAPALRARPAPPAADDARRRRAPHPHGLQPRLLAARHAGALLRRGDRDGREPRHRGPLRACAPRCSGRPSATRASRRPCRPFRRARSGPERRQRRGPAARPAFAPELDGAADPAAQGVPRARLGIDARCSTRATAAVLAHRSDWEGSTIVALTTSPTARSTRASSSGAGSRRWWTSSATSMSCPRTER